MADYKFVTREDIEKQVQAFRLYGEGCTAFNELEILSKRLLAERDAYREAYINFALGVLGAPGGERILVERNVDAEAAKLLGKK